MNISKIKDRARVWCINKLERLIKVLEKEPNAQKTLDDIPDRSLKELADKIIAEHGDVQNEVAIRRVMGLVKHRDSKKAYGRGMSPCIVWVDDSPFKQTGEGDATFPNHYKETIDDDNPTLNMSFKDGVDIGRAFFNKFLNRFNR